MKIYSKILTIFILTIIVFTNLCFASVDFSIPTWNESTLLDTAVSSTNLETSNNALSLESKAAILMDANTGEILYNHNCHEKLRPASVTKVMSLLLIMEALDSGKITLEDRVPCSENARKMGGSQIWLAENEQLTVNEMLKAICIVSANDCTVAMAEFLEGSEEAFVAKMNTRAKELGMNDTTFVNCHGIDEDGHVTSAHDIAVMSKELTTKHPKIFDYTTIWMDSLRDGKSELVNTNKLIRNYKGATGLKTGSTSLALYNLSATATRDNLNLVAVIMGAPTTKVRFAEATKLLDYGFANYSSKKIATSNELVKEIPVIKGGRASIGILYAQDLSILLKKGEDSNIDQTINIPEYINAPIGKGDKVGDITYTYKGQVIGKVDLVAQDAVVRLGLGNMFKLTFDSWYRMLR